MINKFVHLVDNFFRKRGASSPVYRVLILAKRYILDFEKREHRITGGKLNPGQTFFVIRPTSKEEGLLSLFKSVMRNIEYAEQQGWSPIVDMQNYPTQYNCPTLVNNTRNAWEYFFLQPTTFTLEEVYHSRNVILSGWRPNQKKSAFNTLFNFDFDDQINKVRYDFISSHSGLQPKIRELVQSIKAQMFTGNVLGVYIRGTDYTVFKPKGHPIQPEIDDVLEQTTAYLDHYPIAKIFLVTEDSAYAMRFIEKYGDRILTFGKNNFDNYDGRDYLSHYLDGEMAYQNGLEYLIRMLLLAACDYQIMSITNGSLFTLAISDHQPESRFLFQLGTY
jgi:hypothetical protein